jgi:hypothetical protein
MNFEIGLHWTFLTTRVLPNCRMKGTVTYVPQAKLDGAKEGRRKDSRKKHHEKMPTGMSGQSWSNHQVRQTVVPLIASKPQTQ